MKNHYFTALPPITNSQHLTKGRGEPPCIAPTHIGFRNGDRQNGNVPNSNGPNGSGPNGKGPNSNGPNGYGPNSYGPNNDPTLTGICEDILTSCGDIYHACSNPRRRFVTMVSKTSCVIKTVDCITKEFQSTCTSFCFRCNDINPMCLKEIWIISQDIYITHFWTSKLSLVRGLLSQSAR